MPSECVSTKRGEVLAERFWVIDCDEGFLGRSESLKEAEEKASKRTCAIVLKVLRLCGTGAEELDRAEAAVVARLGGSVSEAPRAAAPQAAPPEEEPATEEDRVSLEDVE